MNVVPLFPSPVYTANLGEFFDKKKILEVADSLAYDRIENSWSSTNKYVLEVQGFEQLKLAVEKQVEFFVNDVLHIKNHENLYVTNSWLNKHEAGDMMPKHYHNNSLISGVLYLNTNEKSGDIVFHRKSHDENLFPSTIELDFLQPNIFNTNENSYHPNVGDIILFPSKLYHSAKVNESSETRYCIAFNVFVRGTLGYPHTISF